MGKQIAKVTMFSPMLHRFTHNLVRDTTLVSAVTLVTLVLSGLLGVALVQMVANSGYQYTVSSFGERIMKLFCLKLERGGKWFMALVPLTFKVPTR